MKKHKKNMRWRLWILCSILLLGLPGCGKESEESGGDCLIELTEVPKEMDMLGENVKEHFSVRVSLQNIYTEKRHSVELYMEDDFQTTLKLKPGTYQVESCSVSDYSLLPMEVKAKTDTVEVLPDKKAKLQIKIENPEAVSDWIWDQQAQREIMEAGAFSHKVQFRGEIIDLKEILNYIEVEYDKPIKGYEKQVLPGSDGISITVMNETAEPLDWQNCTLKKIHFGKANVIWGQGAYPGMAVKDAVHATEGLYGKPTKMGGTVLAGTGYGRTQASWLDEKSGDKLSLWIATDGEHISSIEYEFAVFE